MFEHQDLARCTLYTVPAAQHGTHATLLHAFCRYLLTETYSTKAPELAAMVLNTMIRYINWIDISLVANEK